MQRQSLADQALHLLALENVRFRKFSFDRECRRNRSAAKPSRKNLFIAGLARAGSTALLNALFASGQFAATTYALMPFLLAPSFANRMSTFYRGNGGLVERMQGDGIQVGIASPEALDGIFWSTYLPTTSEAIQPRPVPDEVLQRYAMHIENLLTTASAQRYLCKMNQSIDKLESLASYFSESIFLIPFRDPLLQATSLLRQHRRFSNLSWFEKRYMAWQQHFEFGDLHHGYGVTANDQKPEYLDYWLQQWQNVYRYLAALARQHNNLILLRYETIGSSPQTEQQLSRRLNLELDLVSFTNKNRKHRDVQETYDRGLLETNNQLYQEMSAQSEARLCSDD